MSATEANANDPARFRVERVTVRDGMELAFVHEGVGGFPLVLLHGWPETKRIWWRNVEPLAAAGFEVIAPDLRGYGDSGLAPDGHYDPASMARDVHALVQDELGHGRCVAAGGDVGGVVIQDLGLRFEEFVVRQCLFNTVPPVLPDEYERAGIEPQIPWDVRVASDYYRRQGRDADGLAAELDTPERRCRYVAQFYGSRFWATPGAFTPDDVDFMTEPFADGDKLRSSFGIYETALGTRPPLEPPRLFERNPVPTIVLYGPDDHVMPRDFPERCEVAFTERVGPFVVPRAGHFLQWERASLVNQSLIYFFRDLVVDA